MKTPAVLLGASLLVAGAAFAVPGLTHTVVPVALIAAFAALVLLGRALIRRTARPAGRRVIIDGSNVMFWNGGTPALETVDAVVRDLAGRGFLPGVIFDANAGYKIANRYQDDAELAQRLGLPADRVLVVPRGTPADVIILKTARALKAPVVTNDRFRDWAADYPEVAEPGFLIRGGLRDGKVWTAQAGQGQSAAKTPERTARAT